MLLDHLPRHVDMLPTLSILGLQDYNRLLGIVKKRQTTVQPLCMTIYKNDALVRHSSPSQKVPWPYKRRGSITVWLAPVDFIWIQLLAYVELAKDLLVWSNPNQ